MWTMLAGVPGKLKTLIDRLTATRAANLDKLDANITTRAAAATALSNAVWTDTRAGKLDLVGNPVSPIDEVPLAGGLGRNTTTNTFIISPSFPHWMIESAAVTTSGPVSALALTGRGVITHALVYADAGAGESGAAYITVTIDGVAFTQELIVTASSQRAKCLIGGLEWGEQIPFYSSLSISIGWTTRTGSPDVRAYYRYRQVA